MPWVDDNAGHWKLIPMANGHYDYSEPKPTDLPPSAGNYNNTAGKGGPDPNAYFTQPIPIGVDDPVKYAEDQAAFRKTAAYKAQIAAMPALNSRLTGYADPATDVANSVKESSGSQAGPDYYNNAVAPLLAQINARRTNNLEPSVDAATSRVLGNQRPDVPTPAQIGAQGTNMTQIDQASLDPYRAQREQGLSKLSTLLDSVTNMQAPSAPTDAERDRLGREYFDTALQQQLAVGRSGPGGLAAVQSGMENAMNQAPQLRTEAAQQSRQDASARFADKMATYNAQLGTAGTAGGIANNLVQGTQAQFGAEADLASKQADLGLGVLQQINQASGNELQYNSAIASTMGKLASDLQNIDLASMKLTGDQQNAFFDSMVKIYGIDNATYAAIKTAAMSKNVGPLDMLKIMGGLIDTGATVVGTVYGGPAGGIAAHSGAEALLQRDDPY